MVESSISKDSHSLDELVRLVGWEGRGKDLHWATTEQVLGLRLPTDYKHYVERFPSGIFQIYLSVYTPFESGLHPRILYALEGRRVIQADRDDFPYAFHPEKGGLLPWGITGSDFLFCWLTGADDPDQWPTIVCDYSLLDEFHTYSGSMTAFIVDLIRGETGISEFGPEAEVAPSYTPFDPKFVE